MSKLFPRGCTIFNCDRRHGNYCCADCGYKKACQPGASQRCRPCKNSPEKCGLVRENVPKNKEVREYAESRKDGGA